MIEESGFSSDREEVLGMEPSEAVLDSEEVETEAPESRVGLVLPAAPEGMVKFLLLPEAPEGVAEVSPEAPEGMVKEG